MNFQVNYAPQAATAPQRPVDAPLYASVAGIAHALGQGECAFQPRGTGETHVMTTQVLEALDLTRPFLSLDEHAANVSSRIPALRGQFDAVKRVLGGLASRKLLVSDAEFLDGLRAARAREPQPLAAVMIRACDRPAQLAALFETLVATERAGAGKRRYVVLDDSRDGGNRRANAEASRAFAQQTSAKIEIIDAPRWSAIVDRIAKACPAHAAAVRESLAREADGNARFGGGKGYNLAALLGAGARYALLDEDFLLPLRSAGELATGLELVASGELPARLFADVDAALAEGQALERDPFATQLAWCGQSLGRLLADEPLLAVERADLRGIAPSRHPELAPDTRVIATANGHRGSSGASVPHWLFLVDGDARRALFAGREEYLRQIDGAAVSIGPARARLLPHGNFTPFLVDASTLLAPTLPTGRSEDLLFGALTGALNPDSAIIHSPWTMGHRQEARGGGVKRLFEPDTPGLSQYLCDWLRTRVHEIRAATPERRAATIAAWLEDLAAAPRAARIELLDEYLRFNRADLIAQLQRAFAESSNAPIYWQADVRELITVNAKTLTQSSAPRLAGWPESYDAAACADRLSSELAAFARSLAAWPAIWTAAVEQRERWLAA